MSDTQDTTLNSTVSYDDITIGEDESGKLEVKDKYKVDTEKFGKQQMIMAMNVLRLMVDATLTETNYDDLFLDIFTDADGYDDTIDTVETDATFDTDHYESVGGVVTDATGLTLNDLATGVTGATGMKIESQGNYYLLSVTKTTESTCTTVYLKDSTKSTTHATATFSGNTATFDTPYQMSSSTSYWLMFDSGGSEYNAYRKAGGGLPTDKVNVHYDAGWNSSSEVSDPYVIINVITTSSLTPNTSIVQTNKLADLDTAPIAYQVYANTTLAGNATINYDISFDNGVTWLEDKSLNTQYTYDGEGTEPIIKFNLTSGGIDVFNSVEISNYCIIFWF